MNRTSNTKGHFYSSFTEDCRLVNGFERLFFKHIVKYTRYISINICCWEKGGYVGHLFIPVETLHPILKDTISSCIFYSNLLLTHPLKSSRWWSQCGGGLRGVLGSWPWSSPAPADVDSWGMFQQMENPSIFVCLLFK